MHLQDVPDHPEVSWAERTGYPSFGQPKDYYCDVCEKLIEDDVYEDYIHDYLCQNCLLELHKREVW